MKKTIYCICFFVFLFVFCNFASAQVKPGTFYVGPSLGGYVFDSEQRLDNMPIYGVRFGYYITKYFGVEASGGYVYTNYDVNNDTSHVFSTHVDAVFNILPDSRLVPLIFGGFGSQYIDYPQNKDNQNAYTADWGLGLKYYINDWIALQADVRQVYVFDDSKKDFEYALSVIFHFPTPHSKAK
ncbi:MAG: outer membrane beta-barrel protein [Smithella sp.]